MDGKGREIPTWSLPWMSAFTNLEWYSFEMLPSDDTVSSSCMNATRSPSFLYPFQNTFSKQINHIVNTSVAPPRMIMWTRLHRKGPEYMQYVPDYQYWSSSFSSWCVLNPMHQIQANQENTQCIRIRQQDAAFSVNLCKRRAISVACEALFCFCWP